MPRCRKCNKDWPDSFTACPDDGWSLTLGADATVLPTTPGTMLRASSGAAAAAPAPVSQPSAELEASASDLAPGTVVGEYKIEKKIGEGGMGAVYGAMHPMIGKRAAIKVISAALGTDASAVGRFVQEARSVNQIGHPNIVDVFAFGELPDGRNYFVMEYLRGESLAERIGREAMPLGEAIEILDQVSDALDAAHEKQIVHRDLKPDNVYLAAVRGGRTMVKLLDFGIAKLSVPEGHGTGAGIAKTRTGMMMGTPGYLSPEQARGKNVDHRTDVYALGCMMFEMACGRLPFVADNAMDIVLAHMTQAAPRASEVWPEIPPPLDALIARMLEKDPSVRPSIPEIRQVFSDLITSGLVTRSSSRSMTFGSSIGRAMVTPPPGEAPSMIRSVGTAPMAAAAITGPPAERPVTMQPYDGQIAKKSKTGLIVGVLALVLIGAIALFAVKGGGDKKPDTAPAPVAAVKVEPPKAEPPKPEPPKPEPPKVDSPEVPTHTVAPAIEPATIKIQINVDKAQVTVDDKPVEVAGRMAQVQATEGPHTVKVTAAGRQPFQQSVETKAGATVDVDAKLEHVKTGGKPGTKPGTKPGSKPGSKPGKPLDQNYTVDPFAP